MNWMREAKNLEAEKDRAVPQLVDNSSDVNALLSQFNIINSILSRMADVEGKIINNIQQARQFARTDDLDALIEQTSLMRGAVSAFQSWHLNALGQVLRGQMQPAAFAQEGLIKATALMLVGEQEKVDEYTTYFKAVDDTKDARWHAAYLTRLLVKKEEKCDHVHSMKLVATIPGGQPRTIFQGNVRFPDPGPGEVKGEKALFCPYCGRAVKIPGCVFCVGCGQRLP
jgi:hypothetical protein